MKKIFYTFLLISPLLFISSCEEEEVVNLPTLCQGNTSSIPEQGVFVPNVFTPDEDSGNDAFRPIISWSQDLEYNLSIFNSGGEQVFYTNDPNGAWHGNYNNENGQPCEEGQYNYSITYNGQTLTGGVSLVRMNENQLQPTTETYQNFPEGIQYCFFGDEIDSYYGFVYETQTNLATWNDGNTLYPPEFPCIAEITIVNTTGEPLAGVTVTTNVYVNQPHIVSREGITDNNGEVIFLYANVAILEVNADTPELHGEGGIILEYGQEVQTTIVVN